MKFTKTATFLFPLLDIPQTFFDCTIKDRFDRIKYRTRFVNAFLEDKSITAYKNDTTVEYIFLVLRNYRDLDFDKFYTTLQSFPNYVDDYDFSEYLIVVFKFPQRHREDVNKIIDGKYSQVSADGQKLIIQNNFFSGKSFTLPLIFIKSSTLKDSWETALSNPQSEVDLGDQEVWSIIDKEKEVLSKDLLNSLGTKKVLTPIGGF